MFVFLLATLMVVGAQAKFYDDCGSKLATLQKVGVSGCDENAKECILKRNTNVTISIDFTPSEDVKGIMTDVHGVIMNIPVPFPLPQPDACKGCGLTCPIKSGVAANYKASFPILKSYPKVKVDVKWELKNDADDVLVCILIPAKIN